MPWCVIAIDVDTEKFLSKYNSLSQAVRNGVSELIYFKKTDKGIYERDAGGVYSGYVFADVTMAVVNKLHEQLVEARLGSVLGLEEGNKPSVLSTEEIEQIRQTMQSQKNIHFPVGTSVLITYGPYEDMTGEVVQIIGPVAKVKVPLRKGFSYAEIGLDNLVPVGEV